jgi:FkbH-like protein
VNGHAVRTWREVQQAASQPRLKVRLLSSFTIDPLVPHLGVALAGLGITADLTVGPYNQIIQECADPSSDSSLSHPDVLVVWARHEDTADPAPDRASAAAGAPHLLSEMASAARAAASRIPARLVFALPAVPAYRPLGTGDASNPQGVAASTAALRERLRTQLADGAATVLWDADEVVRAVGSAAAYDHRLDILAHVPYSRALLAAAGADLARAIRLAVQPARKAVVLDADGTLWSGAVSELGAAGIDLGPGPAEAHVRFQEALLRLRQAGLLLALSSKNAETDVWAAFSRREMRLRREHLSAWRIGWQPKHQAITEIAGELHISPDAMVLIDDNPAELAEARAALPGLATVAMPADPALWPQALADPAFDRLPPTDDDRARPRRVAEDQGRAQLQRTVTPEDYLPGLKIWVMARPPDRAGYRRLAQMVLKTNQMNLNGLRLSEQELAALGDRADHEVRVIDTGDRFGDYGQVGAYVLATDGTDARLVLFLISCRALGRGVERAMVAYALERARRRGAGRVLATVRETSRNEPARRFFASVGCPRPEQEFALEDVAFPPYLTMRPPPVRHG